MASDDDVIKIIGKFEGEEEAKRLQAAVSLADQKFKALYDTLGGSAAQTKLAAASLSDLQVKLDQVTRSAQKMDKAKQASAKFQIGLAGANTLQDVIQGGPASGINNILGLAGNNTARAMAGEWLAAAGGIGVVGAALGTVAIAAGAAFLVIDNGLKEAKLDWGDFDDVLANTHAWKAVKSTASGVFEAVKEGVSAYGTAVMEMGGPLAGIVEGVQAIGTYLDDNVIGWNQATEAARAHKEAVKDSVKELEAYKQAQKTVGEFKSTEETEKAKRGKLFGQELANLGGDRGIQGTIDDLADAQVGPNGDRMVEVQVPELDADGKPTGNMKTVKKSRRDIVREELTRDFANAAKGDVGAQEAIKKRLQAQGRDVSTLNRAQRGQTAESELKAAKERDEAEKKAEQEELDEIYDQSRREEAEKKRIQDAKDKAEKAKKDAEKAALDKAKDATAGTAFGSRIDSSLIRGALKSGGSLDDAAREVREQISQELQSRGLSKAEADSAADQLAKQHAAGLSDQMAERLMGPGRERDLNTPDRIASSDFARSVESAGAAPAEKLQNSVDGMKSKLEDMLRLMQRGARLVR